MAYKRPTDAKLGEDVPVCCNVLVANILDEGSLGAARALNGVNLRLPGHLARALCSWARRSRWSAKRQRRLTLLSAPFTPCAGLLASGIVPAVRHALGGLLTGDARVLPASATVYVQAVELRTEQVAGLDMSAANLYRWHPAYAAGALGLGAPLAGVGSRCAPGNVGQRLPASFCPVCLPAAA